MENLRNVLQSRSRNATGTKSIPVRKKKSKYEVKEWIFWRLTN